MRGLSFGDPSVCVCEVTVVATCVTSSLKIWTQLSLWKDRMAGSNDPGIPHYSSATPTPQDSREDTVISLLQAHMTQEENI